MIRAAVLSLAALVAAQTQNIVQIAQSDPQLSLLVDAVTAGGLVSTLEGAGPFTVFAPLNDGFLALGRNVLDFAFNPHNVKALDNVLTYHVASGAVTSNQLYNGEKIPTLDAGNKLNVTIAGSSVKINQANVVTANVMASNGVVHIIDQVLVPSNFALPPNDIVQTAVSVSALSTLVTAVKAADLVGALSMPNGPYTVFAPTNDAFNKLPAGEVDYLLQHPDELRNVLFYHLLDRRVYSEQITNFGTARTIQGEEVVFFVQNGTVLINGVAAVVTANVDCTNGVVHVIDTVLLPKATQEAAARWNALRSGAPALPNIVQLAQSVPALSTLVQAVVAGNLVSTLESPGPFTVFAPLNTAFDALPNGVLDYLLNNTDVLDQVLTYHVVSGAVYSKDLYNGEKVATVEGGNVTVSLSAFGSVYINDARVVAADQAASNGVVHIIDRVLLPQGALTLGQEPRAKASRKHGKKVLRRGL